MRTEVELEAAEALIELNRSERALAELERAPRVPLGMADADLDAARILLEMSRAPRAPRGGDDAPSGAPTAPPARNNAARAPPKGSNPPPDAPKEHGPPEGATTLSQLLGQGLSFHTELGADEG